MVSSSRFTRRY
ncbi:hypothetical protein ACHAXS_006580 [Conticribra weissflogii]